MRQRSKICCEGEWRGGGRFNANVCPCNCCTRKERRVLAAQVEVFVQCRRRWLFVWAAFQPAHPAEVSVPTPELEAALSNHMPRINTQLKDRKHTGPFGIENEWIVKVGIDVEQFY